LEIRGVIPVLATPFDEDGEIDLASFERQIDCTIEARPDALAMFGLASEYYKLSDDERDDLLRRLLRVANRRVPVIVSVTQHSTELAVKQALRAEESGASAVILLPPFFLRPPVESILAHVEAVAAAVRFPVILQYAPAETSLDAEILARLPVSAVKIDAVPYAPAAASVPMEKSRLAGYMGLELPDAVVAGCDGCMPTASLTANFKRLWQLLKNEPEAGRAYHARMLPLLQFMMQSIEFLIACEKQLLLWRKAIRVPHTRRPRVCLDTLQVATLERYASEI